MLDNFDDYELKSDDFIPNDQSVINKAQTRPKGKKLKDEMWNEVERELGQSEMDQIEQDSELVSQIIKN